MSWNKRTAKDALPPAVLIRFFSFNNCSTIAVEDIARMKPTAIATCHGTRNRSARPETAAAVPRTCAPPRPRIGPRMCHRIAGRNSSPITKSIMTTPNSATCITSWPSVPTNPKQNGPITTPANRYPKTDPSPSRFASGTEMTAASR